MQVTANRQQPADASVQPSGNRPDEFTAFLRNWMQRRAVLIESRRIAFD